MLRLCLHRRPREERNVNTIPESAEPRMTRISDVWNSHRSKRTGTASVFWRANAAANNARTSARKRNPTSGVSLFTCVVMFPVKESVVKENL